jgi:hypothetical protein
VEIAKGFESCGKLSFTQFPPICFAQTGHNMSGYQESEGLLEQNLSLFRAQGSNKNMIPVTVALFLLSKAVLRLAQSIEDNRPLTSPGEPPTRI